MKPKVHEIKVSSLFFNDIYESENIFESDFENKDYQVGDIIVLEEYSDGRYTGLESHRVVSYKIDKNQYGIYKDWCILGLRSMNDNDYKIMEHE